MGQAKRRGDFETRRLQAMHRNAEFVEQVNKKGSLTDKALLQHMGPQRMRTLCEKLRVNYDTEESTVENYVEKHKHLISPGSTQSGETDEKAVNTPSQG